MHGGDIYRNRIELDFSVNTSPMGVPERVMHALKDALSMIDKYPDIHCEELIKLLSEVHDIPEERIVCGNGASELIMAAVHAGKPKTALLIAPGFSGYEYALKAVQAEIFYYYLEEERGYEAGEEIVSVLYEKTPDIFFLTNPNNPTGRKLPADRIERIVKACQRTGTLLVIDECFMELTDDEDRDSFCKRLEQYKNAVILRAFTKSFCIPGVRLGYCLCSDAKLAKKVQEQLPEWNVSVLAQCAGAAALREKEDMKQVRDIIKKERKYLVSELTGLGVKVFPSDANYLLFYDDRNWYELLLKEKILIRDCSDYEGLGTGYYRIAVKRHEENLQLIGQMKKMTGKE